MPSRSTGDPPYNVIRLVPSPAKSKRTSYRGPPPGSDPDQLNRWIRRVLIAWGALAGGLAPFVFLGYYFSDLVLYSNNSQYSQKIALEGQSTVELNAHTTLKAWREGATRRFILVRGEGLFDIRGKLSSHLVVSAGEVDVKDLGTTFSVRRGDDGKIEVTLAQGSVTVTSPHIQDIHLIPNQQVIVAGGSSPPVETAVTSISPAEIQSQWSWRDIELGFDCSRTIGFVADQINQHSRDKIVVTGNLASLNVSAIVNLTNAPEFLMLLQSLSSGIKIETANDRDHKIYTVSSSDSGLTADTTRACHHQLR